MRSPGELRPAQIPQQLSLREGPSFHTTARNMPGPHRSSIKTRIFSGSAAGAAVRKRDTAPYEPIKPEALASKTPTGAAALLPPGPHRRAGVYDCGLRAQPAPPIPTERAGRADDLHQRRLCLTAAGKLPQRCRTAIVTPGGVVEFSIWTATGTESPETSGDMRALICQTPWTRPGA